MPPDNRSLQSWLWPAGRQSDSAWLTRTKRRVVPLLFLNCQPQPWDFRVKDETVTLTTRSKELKHDKCDYNFQESHLGRQGRRLSQQDIQLLITLGRVGTFKAKQLIATSRKVYSDTSATPSPLFTVTVKLVINKWVAWFNEAYIQVTNQHNMNSDSCCCFHSALVLKSTTFSTKHADCVPAGEVNPCCFHDHYASVNQSEGTAAMMEASLCAWTHTHVHPYCLCISYS